SPDQAHYKQRSKLPLLCNLYHSQSYNKICENQRFYLRYLRETTYLCHKINPLIPNIQILKTLHISISSNRQIAKSSKRQNAKSSKLYNFPNLRANIRLTRFFTLCPTSSTNHDSQNTFNNNALFLLGLNSGIIHPM
ncbi:MAG: hypothetical protein PHV91_09310, partial [Bacteroidales bacterium]|nr:hypothetical protein [Bacteroidales bacterium]